jgi:hypothetical protein
MLYNSLSLHKIWKNVHESEKYSKHVTFVANFMNSPGAGSEIKK